MIVFNSLCVALLHLLERKRAPQMAFAVGDEVGFQHHHMIITTQVAFTGLDGRAR